MRVIRSIGESFTKLQEQTHSEPKTRRLLRGVRQKPDDLELLPEELSEFLKKDARLAIRQTIAVLDKVVGTVRSLKTYEVSAYVDRVHLGEALWQQLSKLFSNAELTPDDIKDLRERWQAKTHPYARKTVMLSSPRSDPNALVITKAANNKSRDEFERKWHGAFWRKDNDGNPDYEAIAKAIMEHLHVQEHILSSKGDVPKHRTKAAASSRKGLIEARALSIMHGTNDPREGRRAGKDANFRSWPAKIEDIYFQADVAKTIYAACTASPVPNAVINSAYIGQILFEHFGTLKNKTEPDTEERKQICDLHTAVRDHYRKLASSERFRRAVGDAALSEELCPDKQKRGRLKLILPADNAGLLKAIGARKRNARFSELIRLGKMVAHASGQVTVTGDGQQATFDNAMDWFATSDGQAEIKRNESFVRAWRGAVAQSFSTLRALVDPSSEFADLSSNNEDEVHLTKTENNGSQSRKAALALNDAAYKQQLQLVFGARSSPQRISRASLFSNDEIPAGETAWAFMRLASVIRDRASHFMVKGRFLALIRDGALAAFDPTPNLATPSRSGGKADTTALNSFDKLLAFDEALDWQVIIDSLTSLKAGAYLSEEQINEIIGAMAQTSSDPELTVPRFMATMKRAQNLVGHGETILPGIESLELKNLKDEGELNLLKLGLLRLVYQSGFQAWLAENDNGGDDLKAFINDVIAAKRARSQSAAKEQKRAYVDLDTLLSASDLSRFASLKDLLSELQRLGMQANGDHLRYKPDGDRQSAMSREIEQFRQEMIAALFDLYLNYNDINLAWIWDLAEPTADQQPIDLAGIERPVGAEDATRHGHEAQFYAWLYLLPVETVARLRHQFRKTMVLDARAIKQQGVTAPDTEADAPVAIDDAELVSSMDRLMALYVRVQGAGFDGSEHQNSPNLGALLYEDPSQFESLFSDANDENIAGTRSGLREILRFGHLAALNPVFKYHKVTAAEVAQHSAIDAGMQASFEQKHRLHDEISKLADKRDRDDADMTAKCGEYATLITTCTLHNFSIRAARLNDHIRAHHLVLSVVGRLVDFAGMWERDRFYLLLGMLYRQWQDSDYGVKFTTGNDNNYGIARGDETGSVNFIPIWNEKDGFALHRAGIFWQKVELLEETFKAEFARQFAKSVHNPLDKDRKQKKNSFVTGKEKIRNDLAHYNILHPRSGERLNLTYLVNAVRSLFGHDRKMKNIIPRAIHDVLAREGVTIAWKIAGDRLKHPLVLPVIETHLSMVKPIGGRQAPVKVPQTSVRFVSMVKGLFEHDKGGNRALVTEKDGKSSCKGVMRYPQDALFAAAKGNIPEALLTACLPELDAKSPLG